MVMPNKSPSIQKANVHSLTIHLQKSIIQELTIKKSSDVNFTALEYLGINSTEKRTSILKLKLLKIFSVNNPQ